jgi:hypothetical protein
MRDVRSFIHIILAIAILSTGLPLYHPADMNRDGEIGLTDAIVSVRQLSRVAKGEDAFRDGMENTLTSLSVVAGLKSVIRAGRDPGCETSVSALPVLMIHEAYRFEALPPVVLCATDGSLLYDSPIPMPITPPPRTRLT